ncbi:hypothetical protein KIN20_003438 [Parelaphostrongylus tenuis]|uniref:Uncharacterized protein n=1 Tax=Parelaphostrongylus tenuis TaxID=148309 RepID=A0AAD5QHF3_PARTN|nr:hypothetical protein KIN20_003438 [Parelaphostrongylus tenuis]
MNPANVLHFALVKQAGVKFETSILNTKKCIKTLAELKHLNRVAFLPLANLLLHNFTANHNIDSAGCGVMPAGQGDEYNIGIVWTNIPSLE